MYVSTTFGTQGDVRRGRTKGIADRGIVGASGVLEDQPLGELPVEQLHVGEEHMFVVVHEELSNGSVEALQVGVHVRAFGIGISPN